MLIPVLGLVVLLVLLVLLITSRYKVAGPNQAYIVTGRKGKAVLNPETGALSTDLSGQKVILGGGTFVIPFVQKLGHDGPLQPPDLGADPRCGVRAGHQAQRRGRRDRQGGRQRRPDPARRAAVPQPAGGRRAVHPGGARRRAALDHRRAHRRADHPRPGGVRPAGCRRVGELADGPGADPRHLPDPGRHRRRRPTSPTSVAPRPRASARPHASPRPTPGRPPSRPPSPPSRRSRSRSGRWR